MTAILCVSRHFYKRLHFKKLFKNSEFNRFYKLTLANIEVVEKSNIKLLTWINEAITEDITDETSKLEEKIIPALQEGIESCKNFLVYCNENILSFLGNYESMKVSNDLLYYFLCEWYSDRKIYVESKKYAGGTVYSASGVRKAYADRK